MDAHRQQNRKIQYPGVVQLVARVVWDHQAAGSSPVTRTITALSFWYPKLECSY